MKTITLLILFFTLSTISAQIVNIPDPNFKNALLNHELMGGELIDTNHDGEIQVSEAVAITELYVGDGFVNFGIQDMTGIEAFVNITKLNCVNNYISTLDLSYNTALLDLKCYINPLSSINVSNCVYLERINAYQTNLTSINLTENANLKSLNLRNNNITYLDVRNGNNINFNYFNADLNPNLTCIFVDDAEYSENAPAWFKDPASTYVETEAECDAISVEDVFLQSIRAYPNPVKNTLYLQTPGNHSSIEISIVDVKGNSIINHLLQDTQAQIDISHLHSGIYFVILKAQQTNNIPITIGTKKLIKL